MHGYVRAAFTSAVCVIGLAGTLVVACAHAQHRVPATAWSAKEMELAVRARANPRDVANHHVVLVAIDGVRWQDVFEGVDPELARRHRVPAAEVLPAGALIPNLYRLAESRGAVIGAPDQGASINASGPNYVSLPGYMEMLTGRSPSLFRDNDCPQIPEPTVLDELMVLPGTEPTQISVVASWEGIEKAVSIDPGRIAISVGRTSGKTRSLFAGDAEGVRLLKAGEQAGPAPGHADFRRDQATSDLALHYLRTERPRFMFLGLGETDEYGHRRDYRNYLRALRAADRVIGELARVLEEFERAGQETLLLVTTDHGRSHDFESHGAHAPESARVWLFAAGSRFAARGYARALMPRRLADLAPTVRFAVGLPRDPSRYAGNILDELLVSTPPSRRRTVAIHRWSDR